jgi:hypothetical protein
MCAKPIRICTDCLCYLANGDVPEDRPDLPIQIDRNWTDWDVVLSGDPEEDEGSFSWSSCDCCGSNLGGYRYSAVAYPLHANV